jgi:hypothetical protein
MWIGLAIVSQGAPAKAPSKQSGTKDADLEKALNQDAASASVITVLSSGDLVLFDGAFTVPAVRPSVDECGIWISLPPKQRPEDMGELRKKAEREAYQKGMSPRERQVYVMKALEPKRECSAAFKKKCTELKERVALETRKHALDEARKAIDRLLAEERVKVTIREYLANVLIECPLEE